MSHFSVFQVNDLGIFQGTQFIDFASTENLCVDLLWQLEFIHTFNKCPIRLCVT